MSPAIARRPRGVVFARVGKTYRRGHVAALRGVSFEIAAGEAVAFIGPSGAGKTTITMTQMMVRGLTVAATMVARSRPMKPPTKGMISSRPVMTATLNAYGTCSTVSPTLKATA